MPVVNSIMVGVAHFNYKEQGWSERYYLDGTTYEDAKPKFMNLCLWRHGMCATGVVLQWARVSRAENPRDAVAVVFQPKNVPIADAPGDNNLPHDAESGLLVRQETDQGKWGNRILRGIADPQIYDRLAVGALPAPPAPGVNGEPPAGITRLEYFAGFMAQLPILTVYAKPVAIPQVGWDKEPWARCVYRNIRNRKTGRAFGITRGRRASD